MPGSIERSCRACGRPDPVLVLDLGSQPAADHFPSVGHPGPDPTHPLALRLCAACGLAQLDRDDTDTEEPRAVEPAALRLQAAAAVAELAAAGCLTEGATAAEFGSPHGGSWQQLLAGHGVQAVGTEPADLVLDCFGMMHEADQAAAVQARADRLAPAGTLLLQFHSIAAILRQGQWNALRHGHFAYYSLTALIPLLATAGLRVRRAWEFDLYGGTVLIAADRTPAADRRTSPADDNPSADGTADDTVSRILADEKALGVTDPERLRILQVAADLDAGRLHRQLTERRAQGRRVYGYGAASRAVALMTAAGIDRQLLAGIADASPGKWGRRMPGTDIPVISPADLIAADPDQVLLLLPDLLPEVEAAYPALAGAWSVHATPSAAEIHRQRSR